MSRDQVRIGLEALINDESEGLSDHAAMLAIDLVEALDPDVPMPRLIVDQDGGLVFAWEKGQDSVRLNLPPYPGTRAFIYRRLGKERQTEEFTSGALIKRRLAFLFTGIHL